MELKIDFAQVAGGLLVRLTGRIDFHTGPDLEERIKHAIEEHHEFLLINLGKVSYLPSLAIATLLSLSRYCAEKNMKVGLCELPPAIKRMLQLAEVGQAFPEFKTEAEALAALELK